MGKWTRRQVLLEYSNYKDNTDGDLMPALKEDDERDVVEETGKWKRWGLRKAGELERKTSRNLLHNINRSLGNF